MHKFKWSIGDLWDDGHGKYHVFYVESNFDKDQLYNAIKSNDIDFTSLCCDYQDNCIWDPELTKIRILLGIPFDDENMCIDDNGENYYILDIDQYVDLIIKILKAENPTLELRVIEDNATEMGHLLGGYGFFE